MHYNNIISSEHFHWSCTGNCWKSSYQHLNEYTGYLWMLIFWVVFEVFESSIMHYKSLFHYYLVYCTSQVFLSRYMFLKLFQVFYMCNLILSLFTAKVTDFLMSFSMCKFETDVSFCIHKNCMETFLLSLSVKLAFSFWY